MGRRFAEAAYHAPQPIRFHPRRTGAALGRNRLPGESYRPACVNRLVSVICRAARNLGETIIFEQNGPALWARVQGALKSLLTTAWSLNALDGATVADAFSVRCDASTMTQNDLDNGRLVAEIVFTAAATIELIRVTLALEANRVLPQAIRRYPRQSRCLSD